MSDFGIVITCYRGDYRFAKGCCASVRYFAGPDVPITLLVDGDVPTRRLEQAYGVSVIRRAQVPPGLHRCFGYGLTKLLALFVSPYERFLHLDADTHLWGNILDVLPLDEPWDFIYDSPVGTKAVPADKIAEWYFGREQMRAFDPAFEPEDYREHLFNSGVWLARRGAFDLGEVLRLLDAMERHPGLFYVDQGLLNYLVLRAMRAGERAVRAFDLQSVVVDYSPERFGREFAFTPGGQPLVNRPTVVHYVYHKPNLYNRWYLHARKPMDAFRLRAARDMFGVGGVAAGTILQFEDGKDWWRAAGVRTGTMQNLRMVRYAMRDGIGLRRFFALDVGLAEGTAGAS